MLRALTTLMAAEFNGQNEDNGMRVAIRVGPVIIGKLVVDPPGPADLVVDRAGESRRLRLAGLAPKNARCSDRWKNARCVRHVIPELLGCLEASSLRYLVPQIHELAVHQNPIPWLRCRSTSRSSRGNKWLVRTHTPEPEGSTSRPGADPVDRSISGGRTAT